MELQEKYNSKQEDEFITNQIKSFYWKKKKMNMGIHIHFYIFKIKFF
jgi:hypothetical protein